MKIKRYVSHDVSNFFHEAKLSSLTSVSFMFPVKFCFDFLLLNKAGVAK